MSDPERFVDIACPYCGEWITLALDLTGGDQHYIEDCQVCCKPIAVSVRWDEEGEAQVSARGQDDAWAIVRAAASGPLVVAMRDSSAPDSVRMPAIACHLQVATAATGMAASSSFRAPAS